MKVKDWGLFWLVGSIWGTSFLWIKIAVNDVSPVVLVAFRTLFGSIGLGLIIAFNKKARVEWETLKAYFFDFFILGLINIAVPWILLSWGSQFVDSGKVAVLNGTMPLFTILLSSIFIEDDHITLPKAAGLAIGFLGVVVLMSPSLRSNSTGSIIKYIAILSAPFCYAVSTIFARKKTRGLPPQIQAFLQMFFAAIPIWIFALLTEKPFLLPQHTLSWVALIWLGLLGSCIAYIIYFFLLHRIGPTRISMVTYIPPLIGMVLGIIFLGEKFYWQGLIGALLILSGIGIVNLRKQKETQAV